MSCRLKIHDKICLWARIADGLVKCSFCSLVEDLFCLRPGLVVLDTAARIDIAKQLNSVRKSAHGINGGVLVRWEIPIEVLSHQAERLPSRSQLKVFLALQAIVAIERM